MAGSYRHCVDQDGNFYGDQDKELLLDHLGDAYGAIEEMYDMIHHLTGGDKRAIFEAWREGHVKKRLARRLTEAPTLFTEERFWYRSDD